MLEIECPECKATSSINAHRALLCARCAAFVESSAPKAAAKPMPIYRDLTRQAMADDDDDAAGDEEEAPKKKKMAEKKGGMSMGLILAIVGVLLLCCICSVGSGVGFIFLGGSLVPSAQMAQTKNNMKQIGLAAHNHFDAMKSLPTPRMATADLSWRVEVLPYLEQGPLFAQIDKTKGWNQAPNQAFQSQRPELYNSPLHPMPDKAQTPFQYFTGPNTLFPQSNSKASITNIKDGSSNTILFAESSNPVPWMKPADMNANLPLQVPAGQFLICLADGSVRLVNRARVNDQDILGMINPNDGKALPLGID